MVSHDSRAEYTNRIHRVLEYIDSHLDQPLELSMLAEVAHFSPFHFHRLFSAWMGETFGDYLRRRRLEVAAMRLAAQPGLPVLNAALSVGFGSSEAFTRAFKTRFGSAPTVWRRDEAQRRATQRSATGAVEPDSNPDQVVSKSDQALERPTPHHEDSRKPPQEILMNVTLIDRQPVRVAYLRHVGPYGQPLFAFWGDVVYPWMVTHNLVGKPRYGISYDDSSITAPEKCRYDACVEVPADFVTTGPALTTTIPGGKYATTHFRGTAREIVEAWTTVLRDWLPSSGMQLDARPCFEYYPTDTECDGASGAFTCDIVIPVVPL